MTIEWYKPEDEVIPTQMRLMVAGKADVYYERLHDTFGYRFRFLDSQVDMAQAMTITDEIVQTLCAQSYDHGASWRETERKAGHEDFYIVVDVKFRVRDAW